MASGQWSVAGEDRGEEWPVKTGEPCLSAMPSALDLLTTGHWPLATGHPPVLTRHYHEPAAGGVTLVEMLVTLATCS